MTVSGCFEKWRGKIGEHHQLVMESNIQVYEKTIENEEDRPFAYGMGFYKLFLLFVIGSFAGTLIETVFALIVEGHFEVRTGMVTGPFIPVYGAGAVLMTLCLYRLYRMHDLIIFAAAAFIGGAFEFLCSYFQEMFLGTISWDYSDAPLNIGGRTSVAYMVAWGILGLIWIRYAYPFISRLIEKIPKYPGKQLTIALFAAMLIGGILTVSAIERKTQRAENNPPVTFVGEFCDSVFTDEYMDFAFPHLGTKETFAEERKQKAERVGKKPPETPGGFFV